MTRNGWDIHKSSLGSRISHIKIGDKDLSICEKNYSINIRTCFIELKKWTPEDLFPQETIQKYTPISHRLWWCTSSGTGSVSSQQPVAAEGSRTRLRMTTQAQPICTRYPSQAGPPRFYQHTNALHTDHLHCGSTLCCATFTGWLSICAVYISCCALDHVHGRDGSALFVEKSKEHMESPHDPQQQLRHDGARHLDGIFRLKFNSSKEKNVAFCPKWSFTRPPKRTFPTARGKNPQENWTYRWKLQYNKCRMVCARIQYNILYISCYMLNHEPNIPPPCLIPRANT